MAPAQLLFSHTIVKPGLCWGWKECPGAQPSGYAVSLPHVGTASAWCQVGPETTERGFPRALWVLQCTLHGPSQCPQGPAARLVRHHCSRSNRRRCSRSSRGAGLGTGWGQGRSSHKWQRCPGGHQPCPGPEHTLFPEGFVCELAPVDRCILPPPPGLARPLHGLLSL